MTKEELIKELRALMDPSHYLYNDEEMQHRAADGLLLAYINDETVTEAFNDIPKWYA